MSTPHAGSSPDAPRRPPGRSRTHPGCAFWGHFDQGGPWVRLMLPNSVFNVQSSRFFRNKNLCFWRCRGRRRRRRSKKTTILWAFVPSRSTHLVVWDGMGWMDWMDGIMMIMMIMIMMIIMMGRRREGGGGGSIHANTRSPAAGGTYW